MRLGQIAWALGLFWALAMSAFAQSITGAIVGVVYDPTQAVVSKAAVRARNVTTEAEHSTETDQKGYYRLANLPPGDYAAEIAAPGFRMAVLSAQRVSVGESLRLDITLEIGSVSESVQVTAVAAGINTEDAQLGKVMREIPQLPVLSGNGGRNALNLMLTQPGVTPGVGSGGAFAVNGLRGRMNNYMFDGADSNDVAGNFVDSVDVISPNALAEFRLVTGPMKAEFGRNSGAVVIVTPKSGGNRFHNIASESFRNTKLNAVQFFQKSIAGGTPETFADGRARNPVFHLHDFDVNLGGPIRKDRTFFFASYLGFRRRQGVVRSATVPNDAERAAIQAAGRPEARALLALVPPATVGNTLLSSLKDSLNRDQGLLKVDHYFSQSNRLSASYFIEDRTEFASFGPSTAIPGFGVRTVQRNQNLVLRSSHAFSPALFHDFRAVFHRLAKLERIPENRTTFSTLRLDNIVSDDPNAEGPPSVAIQGFTPFGNDVLGPLARADSTFQVLDNVSWTRNSHFIKFGGDVRAFRLNADIDSYITGAISVDGSGTNQNLVALIPGLGAQLNDFAQGFATLFQQGAKGTGGVRTRSVNFFFLDDWKPARHFTLNLGLRWEFNRGFTEVGDRHAALRVGQQSTVFPDAPVGLVYAGDSGVSRSTYREDYNNFAPRFGFAWDLLKNGRVSLRGGYGVFFDSPTVLLTRELSNAPPFKILPATRFTDYANPWQGARLNPIPQPFPYIPAKRGDRFDFAPIAPIGGFTAIDADLATPYAQQWTIQLQHQLRADWLLEAGYVGSHGVKLFQWKQASAAIPGPGANGDTDRRRLLDQNNPQNARFGGAVFGRIFQHHSDAGSSYNSLQVNATKRFSRGFQTTHAYTWGHVIDNTSDQAPGQIARIDGGRANRGNSNYDVRHSYVITYIYQFPVPREYRGFMNRFLGGWFGGYRA